MTRSARRNLTKERSGFPQRALSRRQLLARFEAWHQSDEPLNDYVIDRMLGLRERSIERRVNELRLILQFGNQRFTYGGTPYDLARKLVHTLSPKAGEVFYDLGAGYGRVLFYGALTTQAMFRGIELVPERVQDVKRVRKRLRLPNLDIQHGNVCHTDFSDGNIFFLYDPFFRGVLRRVGRRLRDIAAQGIIRIAVLGDSNDYFVAQAWLKEDVSRCVIPQPGRRYGLRFFVSQPE